MQIFSDIVAVYSVRFSFSFSFLFLARLITVLEVPLLIKEAEKHFYKKLQKAFSVLGGEKRECPSAEILACIKDLQEV